MTEHELINALQEIDFKPMEARIYCAFLHNPSASGYSIALQVGIPRARAYQTIEDMLQKGYIMADPGTAGRYSAVPIRTITKAQTLEEQKSMASIQQQLAQLPIVNTGLDVLEQLEDYQAAFQFLLHIIEHVSKKLSLFVWEDIYEDLEGPLRQAAGRKVRVELVICTSGKKTVNCDFASALYYYDQNHSLQTQLGIHWIWMVADHNQGAFGRLQPESGTQVIFTKNLPFLHILSEYLVTFFAYRDFVEQFGGEDFLALDNEFRFRI